MEKTYILLRSNKQQGPYTLAQLAKMDLKRDDLIHVQHGIAGWQYAEEIEVLKPYFFRASSPSFAESNTSEITHPRDEEKTPVSEQSSSKVAGVFARPPEGEQTSYRLERSNPSSSSIHSSLPHKRERTELVPVAPVVSGAVSLQTETFEQGIPERAQAKPSRIVQTRKPVAILFSLFALAALAIGLYRFAISDDSRATIQESNQRSNIAVRGSDTAADGARATLQESLPLPEKEQDLAAEIPKTEALVEKDSPKTEVDKERVVAEKPAIVSNVPVSQLTQEKAKDSPKVAEVAAPKPAPDLTEQIYLKSNFTNNEQGDGVFNLSVSLDNRSDKLLKTVAVNVVFTNNEGQVLNKQTIYFSNIKPGETATRPASQHKWATRVRCELGLVSSEGLLFYAN